MNDNSEEIKRAFDKQLETIEEDKNKTNKVKVSLLYTAFIIVFLFVLAGTILSYSNYLKAVKNAEQNANVIQKVSVKEY